MSQGDQYWSFSDDEATHTRVQGAVGRIFDHMEAIRPEVIRRATAQDGSRIRNLWYDRDAGDGWDLHDGTSPGGSFRRADRTCGGMTSAIAAEDDGHTVMAGGKTPADELLALLEQFASDVAP